MVSARMKPFSKSVWMTPARLRRLGALGDGPGARFLRTGGEIGDEIEQRRSRRGSGGRDPASASPSVVKDNRRARSRDSTAISDSIFAEITTATAPSFARVLEHGLREGVAARRPSLPRHCRHRAPALRSAVRACGNRVLPPACARHAARRLAVAQEHERALDQIELLLRFLVVALGLFRERRRASRGFRDRPASVRSRWSRCRAIGSILPSTWVMSESSKQRTTCAIASTSRILARNWLPSPSPLDAPRTRPAISTKVRRVGMICADLAIAASPSRRGSGTATSPTLGSMVQNG